MGSSFCFSVFDLSGILWKGNHITHVNHGRSTGVQSRFAFWGMPRIWNMYRYYIRPLPRGYLSHRHNVHSPVVRRPSASFHLPLGQTHSPSPRRRDIPLPLQFSFPKSFLRRCTAPRSRPAARPLCPPRRPARRQTAAPSRSAPQCHSRWYIPFHKFRST